MLSAGAYGDIDKKAAAGNVPGKEDMIKIEKALEIILASVRSLSGERVELLSSLNRVLAEDICSSLDLPPFDNSATDGYALIASDTKEASPASPKILEVLEDLPAGKISTRRVGSGGAVRIMTGAPIPRGADAVVMVENTEARDSRVLILKEARKRENIRQAGEDTRKGSLVMAKGTAIRAGELGMLTSLGIARVNVVRRPRVAILATGNELVGVEGGTGPGKDKKQQ